MTAPNRFDVIPQKKPPYLLFFIIFTLLSLGLFYVYLQISQSASSEISSTQEVTPEPTMPLPTVTPIPTIIPSTAPFQPSDAFLPTALPTKKPTPTLKPTVTPSVVKATAVYVNQADKFSVTYKTTRKIYEESADYGHRHVFYAPESTITVHVGPAWSWINDNRDFSGAFLVSGQNTYVYDINSQKIVDFEFNGLKYTVQCVHNANQVYIQECLDFLKSFKLQSS